jgi:hypothetical protein
MLYMRNLMYSMNKSKCKLRRAPNLLLACAELVHTCTPTHPLRKFDLDGRRAIVESVTRDIVGAIRGLVYGFRMPLKDGELRTVAVGMLYLMRQGVTFESIVILPVVDELVRYLPNESMLSVFFDVRAKTITESENRYTTRDGLDTHIENRQYTNPKT